MISYPMTSAGLAGGMVGGGNFFTNGANLPAMFQSQPPMLPPGMTMQSFCAIQGFSAGINGPMTAMRAPVAAGAYAGNPTPPVSPQNVPVFLPQGWTVVMKGVNFTTQPHDVLSFLEGTFEVCKKFCILINHSCWSIG